MDTKKLRRRDFLRLSALGALTTMAAACQPVAQPAAPGEAPSEAPEVEPPAGEAPEALAWTGEIEMYAQTYTPSSVLVNPDPDSPKREAMEVLANEWMDLHPGITLEYINAPAGDYVNWIETQLIGGTGPDIFWIWLGTLNDWADKGKTVPVNDYLALPNKYTPDDQTPWMDTFKSPFQVSFSPKGQWGGVPMDLVSTGVYCNLDILEEAGIDLGAELVTELGSPDSWATFIDWQARIKDAGYFAFGPGAGIIDQWWTTGVLSDQLLWHLIDRYDNLNYHDRPLEFQEDMVSQEELIQAILCEGWDPFEDPAVRDMYRIIKEWSAYFPDGFANPDFGNPYDLFSQGQLAMFWDGSWRVGNILQDTLRDFEFSSFWLPPVTKETSEFVQDPPYLPIGVGGYGSLAYGINHKCIGKGNVDACIDYLMWLTTPEHDEYVVNEVPSFIPANKKAKSLPEVEALFVGETRLVAGAGHPVTGPYSWFGWQEDKWGDIIRRETTLYLLGESDLDTLMANLDEASTPLIPDLVRAAAVQYSDTGSWDLTQWSCEPQI